MAEFTPIEVIYLVKSNAKGTGFEIEPVVPLVRCRDCMFYDEKRGMCEKNSIDYDCRFILPDWFCADGTRRCEA